MTFSQAIEQIRDLSRDDITSIVSDYVELKRSGSGMKGCCPFHEDKTPSFHVSDQKGIYKCFGCGLGGDAIDFVMRIDGKEFHEVIYQFASRFNIIIEKNSSSGNDKRDYRRPDPIPGLKEVRSEIRKAGQVTVICDDTPIEAIDSKATVKVPPPLQANQAKALRKYTNQCELVVGQISWEKARDSIQAGLEEEFYVYILTNGNSMDWIHYVIDIVQPERGEIIRLLAAIPNSITRSIYMTEYSNMLTAKCEGHA